MSDTERSRRLKQASPKTSAEDEVNDFLKKLRGLPAETVTASTSFQPDVDLADYISRDTHISSPPPLVDFQARRAIVATQDRLNRLDSKVANLSDELADIRETMDKAPVRIRVVDVRDMSIPEAKNMIAKYYETHDVAYPSDIADALSIPLKTTVAALEELKKEGKVRGV